MRRTRPPDPEHRRLLLDFSVIAPGGSYSYASGFLNALAAVWPDLALDSWDLVVALPDRPVLVPEEHLLLSAGANVWRLPTALAGTWAARLVSQFAVPLVSARIRPTHVFVPRDIAPLLVRGRTTILVHNVLVWTRPLTMNDGWDLRLMRAAGRLSLRRSYRVLAVSEAIQQLLPARSRRSCRVVHHGCDLPAIGPHEKPAQAPPRRLKVLGLGTISPYKRFDVLIETVARLRDHHVAAELEIWGPVLDQAEGRRLHDLGEAVLGDNPLRGALEPSRRAEIFRTADVVMMGSSSESFGFPMVEGMRTGTVVVAPRSGLVEEICGGCAVTYEEGSAQSAADAILAAFPRFAALADAALRRSEELFTWRRCVEDTLEALLSD